MPIFQDMKLYRRAKLLGSVCGRADASQHGRPRIVGAVVVLVTLLVGFLPAGLIDGASSVLALPATQRGTERVIIEVARGANPEAAARALRVVPTYVFTEVFQGFAVELPAGAIRAAERQRGVLRIWPDLPVRAEAQTLPIGVDRVDADENSWAAINNDGGRIDADVAVLDAGIVKHTGLVLKGGRACMESGYGDGNSASSRVPATYGRSYHRLGLRRLRWQAGWGRGVIM